jgi:membrane protein DedA with SNARE-associated domain
MSNNTLVTLVPWIIAHGYLIFFFGALIEGPLISTAAGVAVSLGYFSLFPIIVLSMFGNLFIDLLFYAIGYKSKKIIDSKFFKYIGITEAHVERIRNLLHSHTTKSLIFIKLSPFMAPPGLIIVGMVHVPFKKFFKTVLIISTLQAFFFVLLGFFSGFAYLGLSKIIAQTQSIILTAIFVAGVIFFYRKITTSVTKELEK